MAYGLHVRFQMLQRLWVFPVFVLLACSRPGAGPTASANGIAGVPSAGQRCSAQTESFSGWENWARKTPARFVSKGHSKKWVEIYVDEAAEPHFDARKGPYPVGSRLVKPQFKSQEAPAPVSITVMKKMPAGYDEDNGDWYYGIFDADGSLLKEGKISMCIRCHAQAASQDYVFARTE